MKCIFIYNPQSGKGKLNKKIGYIKNRLLKKFDEVDVYATQYQGDMQRKIAEIAEKDEYDAVIFSGGDGTFNNVLQGFAGKDKLPTLGYIPSGTVNDIAHSLKIPKSLNGALKVITENRKVRLDCMRINEKDYAMYIVAAGMFTNVAYETPQLGKKFLGKLAYGIKGVATNAKFNCFPLKIETEDLKCECDAFLAFALNSRSVAGMKMNPLDSMADGIMEIAIVKKRQKSNLIGRLFGVCDIAHLFLAGYKENNKDILCIKAKKVKFEAPQNVTWAYDGEKGINGNIEIELIPGRVEIFVPRKLKNV